VLNHQDLGSSTAATTLEMAREYKNPWLPAEGSLDGKVAIVTGATSGLGLETAAGLAKAGCRGEVLVLYAHVLALCSAAPCTNKLACCTMPAVIFAVRNAQKAKRVADEIKKRSVHHAKAALTSRVFFCLSSGANTISLPTSAG
jgi:NAD(P)-dependent dehydrogenase (short-subunit alcohol dehydrogenase family)